MIFTEDKSDYSYLRVPVWLSKHHKYLKAAHWRLQFDIDLSDHLKGDIYVTPSVLAFTRESDREAFESWADALPTEMQTNLLMPFSIKDILHKGSLYIAASVPYKLKSVILDNDYLYKHEYKVVRWVYEKSNRGSTKSDIWYDNNNQMFYFQDPDLAIEFKLKFAQVEATNDVPF